MHILRSIIANTHGRNRESLDLRPSSRARPGKHAPPIDFDVIKDELAEKINRPPTNDEVWSYLMYPQVFLDFNESMESYSDLSVLPTPAYFYGVKTGEEISIDIETGKTLFVELVHVSEPDENANRNARTRPRR